jgi:hypothetical protein
MALIVENGSGVTGADSYVSLADARTYSENRALSLAEDDVAAEAQLRRAFDVIETLEERFSGNREYQSTAFPRKNMWVNGFEVMNDVVPMQVVYAQVQIAIAIEQGFDPAPVVVLADKIVREKLGPIETEYASGASVYNSTPQITAAMGLLRQLFGSSGQQLLLQRGG